MMDWNLKLRKVYCKYCKEITLSDKPIGKCVKCNHELITVIKEDELDTRPNKPA